MDAVLEESQGVLSSFFFSARFYFREMDFREKVGLVVLPHMEKIIKNPNAWSISERESAEDGIKKSFPEYAAPYHSESYLQFQNK